MTGRMFTTILILASLLLPFGAISAQGPAADFENLIRTDDVMGHVRALAVAIGARPAGSPAEERAAAYVAAARTDYGYIVEVQTFDTTIAPYDELTDEPIEGALPIPISSRNVIGTRPGDEQIIVIGAHMDSVSVGSGAGDNGSGVAAMLAVAEAMAGIETTHTLVFVAFGAEEVGAPTGAEVFVERMGTGIENVIAMLNIDTVGMGTNLNVYAGAVVEWNQDGTPTFTGGPVEIRDLALAQASAMGLPFSTTPPETWNGYAGDWGDHYAFVEAGVPIAYFEAWDWTDEYNPWWGAETPEGEFMHSEGDIYENVVPEKVEMVAEVVAATVAALAG